MKKNICFFSGDITRSGGTERVGTVIANELVIRKQFNICFLSLYENQKNPFFAIDKTIKRYALYSKKVSGSKHILGFIRRIHKFVKKENIDILIDIDGILDIYSIPALYFTKTKLISWEQFNYYQNPYVNYRKLTRKWAARKADAIVVLTNKDKSYYEKNLKIKNKLIRIYNPIEKKKTNCQYNIESKMIISVGRLVEEKGFDMLIDVAEKVFCKNKDWQWMILGEGEEREQLQQKIREKHLEDKVILQGNVSNIDDYYKMAAMYVLTSRYEGFGLALTEAKSMGLPCISFRCPTGPAEIIIDGINGYLIDCFDVDSMAEKIMELIQNKERRQEFSKQSLKGTGKFDITEVTNQWENLLMEL